MKNSEFLVKCSCGCTIWLVSKDTEGAEIFISAYELGKNDDNRIGWRDKFRWIKNFLKTGKPYCDYMIISKESAREFAKRLLDMANLIEDDKYFGKTL